MGCPAARTEKRLILTREAGKKTSKAFRSRGWETGERREFFEEPADAKPGKDLWFMLAATEYPDGYEVGSVPGELGGNCKDSLTCRVGID